MKADNGVVFRCPLCQDYVQSIVNHASPAELEKAGVKLVIVSNGSHKLAKAYQGSPSFVLLHSNPFS